VVLAFAPKYLGGSSDRKEHAMSVHQERFSLKSKGHGDMHDLTEKVEEIVSRSEIVIGVAHVFNIGSTGAIGTIEFESGLMEDLPALFDQLMPPSREYAHEKRWADGNGHSHLQASTLGPEVSIPITEGSLVLGSWQQIYHLECDIKPRTREIVVTVTGE